MTVTQSPAPVQIKDLAEGLQHLLTETATDLAYETGFVQRVRLITGPMFAQALIFGWMAIPDASYTQLQEMLELIGCDVSPQALEKRMKEAAADFLLSLLHATMTTVVFANDVEIEMLRRFTGVYLQDGTVISLPTSLREVYKGFGGENNGGVKSALRAQVRVNLLNGQMLGPWIKSANAYESEGPGSIEEEELPEYSLFLADSAYFTLHRMRWLSERNIWWLTHARADFNLQDSNGVKKTLVEYIKQREHQKVIDEWVTLGATGPTRQKVRLIAFRVSEETVERRRRKKNKRTKTRAKGSRRDVRVGKCKQRPSLDGRHRQEVSAKRLKLADWTILITNMPVELVTAHEARVLMRARWQIELIWRLWKERGQVDIWRSEKDMRILCEIYAKMIGMVIGNWMTIMGCWNEPHRSQVKASMVVKIVATSCMLTIAGPISLQDILKAAKQAMKRQRVMNTQKRPSTSGLLRDPSRILSSAIA
jgi:hypothetical protein